MGKRQVPGQPYIFTKKPTGEKALVVLPLVRGENNEDVYWDKTGAANGKGIWRYRPFVIKSVENFRRKVGNRGTPQEPKNNHFPGSIHTFTDRQTGETNTGVLPLKYGEENDFAYWKPVPKGLHGGYWVSRYLVRKRQLREKKAETDGGLISRMLLVLRKLKQSSRDGGYALPIETAEEMADRWAEQDSKCAACGGRIKLFGSRGNPGASYGHCHETGKAHGFLHNRCNMAECYLLRMSDEEFKNYISWIIKLHDREKVLENA